MVRVGRQDESRKRPNTISVWSWVNKPSNYLNGRGIDPTAQVSLGYAPNNLRFDESELLGRRLVRFWRVLHELSPTL